MKLRPVLLCALASLCFAAAAVPAAAQNTLYDNGPINGEVDAFTINFGFAVSDTFTLSDAGTISGLSFGAWQFPGDVLESVDLTISSETLGGGTVFYDGNVNFTASNCFSNSFGFNVCTEQGSFDGPSLNSGTYWLTLQNAVVNTGDPIYWDSNDGVGCTSPGCPSQAQQNSVGSIPSEAFTLSQSGASTTSTTSTTSSTPEPSTLLLLGSGVLGALGAFRKKIQ